MNLSALARRLLPAVLLPASLGPAHAAETPPEVPAGVARLLPEGHVVLGSAAASFGPMPSAS